MAIWLRAWKHFENTLKGTQMAICNSQFSINDIDRWMVAKIDKITLCVALKVSTTWKQQLMAIATATTVTKKYQSNLYACV